MPMEAAGSRDHCEELGDLLFQVIFHAEIARENGAWDFADVAKAISDKIEYRHPHVFAGLEVENADEVSRNWVQLKAAEKAKKQGRRVSVIEGVPRHAPGLLRAERITEKASRIGFDWPDLAGVRAKVDEELRELDEALASGDARAIEHELGDVLFALANLARHVAHARRGCAPRCGGPVREALPVAGGAAARARRRARRGGGPRHPRRALGGGEAPGAGRPAPLNRGSRLRPTFATETVDSLCGRRIEEPIPPAFSAESTVSGCKLQQAGSARDRSRIVRFPRPLHRRRSDTHPRSGALRGGRIEWPEIQAPRGRAASGRADQSPRIERIFRVTPGGGARETRAGSGRAPRCVLRPSTRRGAGASRAGSH